MAIKINSENTNEKIKIDLAAAGNAAKLVLREKGKDNSELNILFVSNQKIRAMNRKYLNIDAATDVIAFPAGKMPGEKKRIKAFLGDIAISSDKAAGNAAEYGTELKEEIALYVIHGTLHLLGYKDHTKTERARMRKKENEFLQKAREKRFI